MELKEIFEDELFQNLLFHTADNCCHHSFTRNNKYEKSNLDENDFKSIDRQFKFYPVNEDSKPSEYFNFVALCFIKGDIDQSIDYLEKFLELYDKPVIKNLKEILTEYAFRASDDTNYYEEQGSKITQYKYLVSTGHYEEVIPLLKKLLNDSDERIIKVAMHLLACCYFELNQFGQAMEYFNMHLSRFPDYQDIYAQLGNYYLRVGEYEKAIEAYNIEKEFFNNHPTPFKDNIRTTYSYKGLIGCYIKIGKIDELMQHFEECLSSTPDNEVLWTYLAMCYKERKENDKAFEMVDKALSINSYYYEALSILGENYYYKEGYNRSIYYLKESIKVKYNELYTYLFLGAIYIKIKDYDKAIKTYKFILSVWSNCGHSHFALANIYKHLGENHLASEYFEKADKSKPFYLNEYTKINFE